MLVLVQRFSPEALLFQDHTCFERVYIGPSLGEVRQIGP